MTRRRKRHTPEQIFRMLPDAGHRIGIAADAVLDIRVGRGFNVQLDQVVFILNSHIRDPAVRLVVSVIVISIPPGPHAESILLQAANTGGFRIGQEERRYLKTDDRAVELQLAGVKSNC